MKKIAYGHGHGTGTGTRTTGKQLRDLHVAVARRRQRQRLTTSHKSASSDHELTIFSIDLRIRPVRPLELSGSKNPDIIELFDL